MLTQEQMGQNWPRMQEAGPPQVSSPEQERGKRERGMKGTLEDTFSSPPFSALACFISAEVSPPKSAANPAAEINAEEAAREKRGTVSLLRAIINTAPPPHVGKQQTPAAAPLPGNPVAKREPRRDAEAEQIHHTPGLGVRPAGSEPHSHISPEP